LRCGPRMNNEVVRGELGWGTLKGRRDEMRLRYWGENNTNEKRKDTEDNLQRKKRKNEK